MEEHPDGTLAFAEHRGDIGCLQAAEKSQRQCFALVRRQPLDGLPERERAFG
jgi:hypothetical protein